MNNLKTFTVCTLYIIESVLATSLSFQRPCCFNNVILSNIRNAVVIQNCFCKSSPFDSAMREPSLSEHVTKPSKQLIDVQKTQVSTEQRWPGGRGVVVYQYTRKKFAKIPKNTQNSSKYTQNYTQVYFIPEIQRKWYTEYPYLSCNTVYLI